MRSKVYKLIKLLFFSSHTEPNYWVHFIVQTKALNIVFVIKLFEFILTIKVPHKKNKKFINYLKNKFCEERIGM